MMMAPVNKHTVLKTVRTTGAWFGYIAPNKVNGGNINTGWHLGMSVLITQGRDGQYYYVSYADAKSFQELNTHLNSFAYYNCNSELGHKIRFWEVV